ncbi:MULTISPECIES: NUDIX hydrolase [Flavobacterium]|uniref:NUDIX domain-containing protein n=1 Tax=Flavobacterium jumunjinense TaxID=998845 RepID=A0ABV5GND1_9FLAO|nr:MULTISPECIES: NUDIX domain-containing protein [Flavobacterium]
MKPFFSYCPNCKSTHFTFENNFRFHCSTCNFTYYHNIAAAVAIVFTFEDKILFTVRNVDPDKGKLDLPGGFIDPNENAEAAACREIKEELGLDLQPKNLKYRTTSPNNYPYKNVPYRTIDIFYECNLESDVISVVAKDEIKELIWIKRSEIDLDSIGFVSIRKVIGEFYSN